MPRLESCIWGHDDTKAGTVRQWVNRVNNELTIARHSDLGHSLPRASVSRRLGTGLNSSYGNVTLQ